MKSIISDFYTTLTEPEKLKLLVSDNVIVQASHPINTLTGIDALINDFAPLLSDAFKYLKRSAFIEFSANDEKTSQHWSAATGYITGIFNKPLLGIPATGKMAHLRFIELVHYEESKIVEFIVIYDFLDLMHQAGFFPLRQSLGNTSLMMPPASMDGLFPPNLEDGESEYSKTLVMDMLDELGKFDGKSLQSMQLEKYWHPDFVWYGPAGIGTTLGISEFRRFHQGPFVFSFPDRSVDNKACLIQRGNYVATGGWPHMHGTHTKGDWLGLPPTNKLLELRVIDIWRREQSLLKENWVGIDIIHMCKQMGLDIFEVMNQSFRSSVASV